MSHGSLDYLHLYDESEEIQRYYQSILPYQYEKRFELRVTTTILPTYDTYEYGLCNDACANKEIQSYYNDITHISYLQVTSTDCAMVVEQTSEMLL